MCILYCDGIINLLASSPDISEINGILVGNWNSDIPGQRAGGQHTEPALHDYCQVTNATVTQQVALVSGRAQAL